MIMTSVCDTVMDEKCKNRQSVSLFVAISATNENVIYTPGSLLSQKKNSLFIGLQ